MSNNPTAALVRSKPVIDFCLAANPKNTELICTRINDHDGHCCDEVSGEAWTDPANPHACSQGYDHSEEKGR